MFVKAARKLPDVEMAPLITELWGLGYITNRALPGLTIRAVLPPASPAN
jgi:hypothetical protein